MEQAQSAAFTGGVQLQPVDSLTRLGRATGALLIVWCLTAGCSSSSDAGSPDKALGGADEAVFMKDAKSMGSPQQEEALADGHVSVEEMEASLEAYGACLASTHWHLEDVYPDPIRGEPHFSYAVVPDRPDSDTDEVDDCDRRTHLFVDGFAQVIQGSGPMDPALRARTHACLEDAGVRTSAADRTDEQIFMTAGKKSVDVVVDCLRAAHRSEYPERDEIGIRIPPEFMER